MRAAVVIHTPRVAHSAIVVGYQTLARACAARGHTLEIAGPADIGAGAIDARFYPLVLPILVRRWLQRRADLDAVIFHSYTGWLCPRRLACRSVIDFHGFEPLYFEAHAAEAARAGRPLSSRYRATYGTLMPFMLRRACRRAALVTCLNSRERAALIDGAYAPAGRVWQRTFGAPAHYPAPHVYRPRATRLVAIMQWLPTKGTRYLIDAFTTLARRQRDLRLRVAGTLRSEADVREAFPEDVRDRVDVVPSFARSAQAAILAEADIFLHASVYEGIGLAILDAMASGIPVVTTRTGVAIDYLDDGRDGLIVPVADAAAIVTAVEGLIDDPARRAALGMSGRRRVEAISEAGASAEYAARLEAIAQGAACA